MIATKGKFTLANHLDFLNKKLLDVAAGVVTRLAVFMPPRHGKSETISRWFCVWFLLNFPDKRVLLASYEAEFAAQWGQKVRDGFNEVAEQFGLRVNPMIAARHAWEIQRFDERTQTWVATGGGMKTAGIGGPLTGRGGDIVIIDDPVKNAEEAFSPTMREKAWDWYRSTLYTRLEPDARIIIVQTRWHEDDLSGRILNEIGKGGDEFEVINFPAIAESSDVLGREPGAALWPQRYDEVALKQIEASVGPYWFAAMYQQQPIPAGKGTFQMQWVGRYRKANGTYILTKPDGSQHGWPVQSTVIFSTVDLATSLKETADFTVISTWALTPQSELLLLDVVRERMEGPEHNGLLVNVWLKYKPTMFYIEQAGFQLTTIQHALRAGLPITPVVPQGDKLQRSLPAAARMKAGFYYFPEGTAFEDEERELWRFPASPHDDFVDTVSLATLAVMELGYVGTV